ncbi:hypothetical protein WCLP8_20006 [uncultured Gammaproteobacteria bacterium]
MTEKRRQIEQQFRTEALTDLAEAQRQSDSLGQELVKAEQRHALLRLTAPEDGTVQQLAVHTLGGVVTPAQVLLTLVPKGQELEVEATLPNKDAGFVLEGQVAEIKVEAFPFTRYGTLSGKVLTVSRDTVQTPDPAAAGAQRKTSDPTPPTPVYSVRIALDRSTIQVDGRATPLTAGMAVTAELTTGRRQMMEYLHSPRIRYRDESLRDR